MIARAVLAKTRRRSRCDASDADASHASRESTVHGEYGTSDATALFVIIRTAASPEINVRAKWHVSSELLRELR